MSALLLLAALSTLIGIAAWLTDRTDREYDYEPTRRVLRHVRETMDASVSGDGKRDYRRD